ncbi:MAG: PAS domain [Candidatus Methanohalarchaeum thermophilum]|uniref:PAS domain n=1 Tax=Methanohalarchaeum thermophilum TaxID=1903181 RepID=A0A1Q6DY16_METT1|nr:MAG: PAS domain [Candidatus Methanohalarchaeum thermophilum]
MNNGPVLNELEIGSHLCCIYRDEEDRFRVLMSLVSLGIEERHKIIVLIDEDKKRGVYNLDSSGVKKIVPLDKNKGSNRSEKEKLIDKFEEYWDKGQIRFYSTQKVFKRTNKFSIKNVVSILEKEIKKANKEGYSGLIVSSDLTWFLKNKRPKRELFDYEEQLNKKLQGKDITLLCFYKEKWFPEDYLTDAIKTHPEVLTEKGICKNYYYLPPDLYKPGGRDKVIENYHKKMLEKINKSK